MKQETNTQTIDTSGSRHEGSTHIFRWKKFIKKHKKQNEGERKYELRKSVIAFDKLCCYAREHPDPNTSLESHSRVKRRGEHKKINLKHKLSYNMYLCVGGKILAVWKNWLSNDNRRRSSAHTRSNFIISFCLWFSYRCWSVFSIQGKKTSVCGGEEIGKLEEVAHVLVVEKKFPHRRENEENGELLNFWFFWFSVLALV